MSQEKVLLLRAFGARVIVTPTEVEPDDPRSYYSVARQIVEDTPNSMLANQYHNPSNPKTHQLTTGPELWEQTEGKIDVFVCGVGTGGTITGVSRYLKEKNPDIQIVGVDPIGSVLYEHFHSGQMVRAHGYKIEGIGEDFLPSTYDPTLVDDIVQVNDKESFLMTRRLVREEGIFCGVSSGSAVVGALKYAAQHQLGEDKLVVVLLPDSGSRYLSKVFNDDWMRENSMLDPLGIGASVETLLHQRSAQKLIMATANESVQSVISKMRHYGVSQLPVVDESQHLIGLVAEVDLLTFMIGNGSGGSVDMSLQEAGVISHDLVTVKPNTPLDSLMKTFATQSVVIVQDGSEVRDIITKIDLIDFLAKSA
jgi:cystathionine beta-synthase